MSLKLVFYKVRDEILELMKTANQLEKLKTDDMRSFQPLSVKHTW